MVCYFKQPCPSGPYLVIRIYKLVQERVLLGPHTVVGWNIVRLNTDSFKHCPLGLSFRASLCYQMESSLK